MALTASIEDTRMCQNGVQLGKKNSAAHRYQQQSTTGYPDAYLQHVVDEGFVILLEKEQSAVQSGKAHIVETQVQK